MYSLYKEIDKTINFHAFTTFLPTNHLLKAGYPKPGLHRIIVGAVWLGFDIIAETAEEQALNASSLQSPGLEGLASSQPFEDAVCAWFHVILSKRPGTHS